MIDIIEKYYEDIAGMKPYVKEKLEKLQRNPDIMNEFIYWIQNGQYTEKGVSVQGYDAKSLAEMSAFLTGEGSFMMLIELRENPQKALPLIRQSALKLK